MKKHLNESIIFLTIWAVSTLLLLTGYGLVQQNLRQGANDPQIQLAEDGAASLAENNIPEALVGDTDVNLRTSLAPAIIVYDDQKQVVVADGKIDGRVPTIPPGILDYAKLHGRDMVTWEPAKDVRLAAVVVPSGGDAPGYVVAVRSLKEVEVRESAALNLTLLAWVVMTLMVFGAWALLTHGPWRKHGSPA